ncbi:MAG TPA: FCD domain-containing protein [Ilumatobacteraceae bacterium]|nr:FCD domain-containing protein [Ilumatobacteraceae bacterium]
MATAAPTRTEQVYARMRSDILSGQLTPGAKLPFAELVARYGGSTSVIREGLTRLVEQGLVQAEPQHGFRVVSLSISDLDDLTTARCELEGLVLRLSIAAGDLEWESAIVAAHHTLERTPRSDDVDADPGALSDEWRAAHSRFHNALIAGCPNVRLRTMASSLRDAAELYRSWSGRFGHDQHRDIPAEHGAIAQAVLSRDADRAVAELTAHLRRTADLLIGLGQSVSEGDGADALEQTARRED